MVAAGDLGPVGDVGPGAGDGPGAKPPGPAAARGSNVRCLTGILLAASESSGMLGSMMALAMEEDACRRMWELRGRGQ